MTTQKTLFNLFVFAIPIFLFGQEGRVGINTTDPKTTFDVNGKKDGSGNLLTTDITGMQAPRLTRAELTSKGNTLYDTDQKGALIYVTDITGGNSLSQRINITAAGYYYFDGSVWQPIASGTGAADITNDAWVNDATNTMVKLGTLSDGSTTRPSGREFVILDNGNVGIGTTAPNSNAILDLSATNKALLLPRVANSNKIATPVDGMMIYSTSQKCFKGYQNTEWVDITTCIPVVTSAITFNKVNKYNGVSVINNQGIGYNGEAIPASSTIEIEVNVTKATAYSFTATDANTGLTYSASGNFAAAGTYPVVLQNNGAAIPWDTYGVLTMTLTGAKNTLALAPRIDIKSIPTTHTDWTYNNVTYGTQTWMDRNLGARRVATALYDVLSYGNHYQWGRPADGHEISVWNGATRTSGRGFADATALEALATSDAPGHPNFILTNATPYDWRSDNNNNRWATANQGPCPAGYHVPTDTEWNTANTFGAWNNNTDAYNSALKLPSAGLRYRSDGLLDNHGGYGGYGGYWSSTVSGTEARHLHLFNAATHTDDNASRAYGFTVRCLKY